MNQNDREWIERVSLRIAGRREVRSAAAKIGASMSERAGEDGGGGKIEVQHADKCIEPWGYLECPSESPQLYEADGVCPADLFFMCERFLCADGFTCSDELIDFGCHDSFNCEDAAFACEAGHVFACDTVAMCGTTFSCKAGSGETPDPCSPPETPYECSVANPYSVPTECQPPDLPHACSEAVPYSAPPAACQTDPANFTCTTANRYDVTPGDFLCGLPGRPSPSTFACFGTDGFGCAAVDDFDCTAESQFRCDSAGGFQCTPGDNFTCFDYFLCETGIFVCGLDSFFCADFRAYSGCYANFACPEGVAIGPPCAFGAEH